MLETKHDKDELYINLSNYQVFIQELQCLEKKPVEDVSIEYEKIQLKKQNHFRLFPFLKKDTVSIEEKNGDILRIGEYITLYGVYKIIFDYLKNMRTAYSNFKELFEAVYMHESLSFEFGDNILDISKKIRIDCSSLPKLITAQDYTKYEFLKQSLYKYLPYIVNYKTISKCSSKDYNICENTKLSVEIFDMLNTLRVTLILRFRDIAAFEISINSCGRSCERIGIEINTYSLDNKTNEYLKNNKEDMLKNILIKENVIKELLDAFKPF